MKTNNIQEIRNFHKKSRLQLFIDMIWIFLLQTGQEEQGEDFYKIKTNFESHVKMRDAFK